jgi:hypothetical protein
MQTRPHPSVTPRLSRGPERLKLYKLPKNTAFLGSLQRFLALDSRHAPGMTTVV